MITLVLYKKIYLGISLKCPNLYSLQLWFGFTQSSIPGTDQCREIWYISVPIYTQICWSWYMFVPQDGKNLCTKSGKVLKSSNSKGSQS